MRLLPITLTLFVLNVVAMLVLREVGSVELFHRSLNSTWILFLITAAVALTKEARAVDAARLKAAGGPPGSGSSPSVRLAADMERGGSNVTGRAGRPKLTPLDRLLLTFVVVFVTLTGLVKFSLHSGAWGNGVIMAFLIPGLAMGALFALVGVVVVPVKLLWRWVRWRRDGAAAGEAVS